MNILEQEFNFGDFPGPMGQEPPSSQALSAWDYGEVGEVTIIAEGSRSELEMLIGVGPGLCGV